MKVLFMTGSHPRHLFIARKLYDSGNLAGLVVERRGNFLPSPPPGILEIDRNNFIRHFQDREQAEFQAFGNIDLSYFDSQLPIRQVTPTELNSEATKSWLQEYRFDIAVSYGIHKLQNDLLDVLPDRAWNIHGGLSPWYRGTVTLFWPFYFLKPNWAGMTIHQLSAKIDAGDIIHHAVPELKRGDGVHDVACRAVQQVAVDLLRIMDKLESGESVKEIPQKSNGKLFLNAEWTPQHLRLIYNTFDNDIVDRYLDGEFGSSEPPLVRAF